MLKHKGVTIQCPIDHMLGRPNTALHSLAQSGKGIVEVMVGLGFIVRHSTRSLTRLAPRVLQDSAQPPLLGVIFCNRKAAGS